MSDKNGDPQRGQSGRISGYGLGDVDTVISVDHLARDARPLAAAGPSAAPLAAAFLDEHGAIDTSSSSFHPGIWYTDYGAVDPHTGARENRSYYLYDFTVDEEEEIFDAMS